MIKFFRHIRQRLVSESKAGKYLLYAFGEILLVVVGILIALQINNWNQDVQDRKQEYKVLSDLKHEFGINRSKLDIVIHKKQEALVNTRKLLYIMKRDHIPMIEIKSAISHSLGVWTYNPSGGTISTILSTGKIDLIQNEELKYALSQYQDVLLDYQEEETVHLMWYIQIMEPYLNQHVPKKYRGDGNEDYLFNTEAELELLYNQAFNDLEFQNLYLTNEGHLNRAVNEADPLSQNIDSILKMLEDQLNLRKQK